MRTQLALFTGPAPTATRHRAAVVSFPATRRWSLLRVPCAFSLPPQVSARINAHIPASPSLPRRPVPFSFFLSLSLSSPLTRAFFIAPRLVVACPSVCQLCGRDDATRWTRDVAAVTTTTTTISIFAVIATVAVAAVISYVRGDTPCRRRAPSRLRGYSRASPSTRRVMRASRQRRPVVRDDSSAVRNVHTQIISAFFSFLPSPREKTRLFVFLLPDATRVTRNVCD